MSNHLDFCKFGRTVDSPGNEWCGIAVAAVDLNGKKRRIF